MTTKLKKPARPFKVKNAACPKCNGSVQYDPATNRIYCPGCEAATAVRFLVRAA